MDKGAHFFRSDMQVHSPRDRNWKGTTPVTDKDRAAYAESLINAARIRGLQAIAVTDHHDMAFVEYVRRASQEETNDEGTMLPLNDRLVVFPGMELTLGVPCQALLIFDADFPADMFGLAMTALAITPNADAEAKTAPVQRLNKIVSLQQLKNKLDEHKYLRNRYIILPNVSDGRFSLLRTGQAGKYIEMPCVGGYVDGALSKVGEGNRRIISGKTKEWGNKRIACFQTSDNRQEDHAQLGVSTTWIKWAVPAAEALRQACLAQESRVSQEEPTVPSACIRSINVSNSAFLGPIDLEITKQYTALIGGRGTGKSTILEYLRWALCDQPPELGGEDVPNYQQRRSRLIEQTIKALDASVEVRFDINEVPHLVRRGGRDDGLQIKIANTGLRPCTEDEVRALLPIQAYSQKQLSDVSVRIEELSRFIKGPIRSELSQLSRNQSDAEDRIRQAFILHERQKTLIKAIRERELEEKSLEEQSNTLRKALTGLSDEDRNLLDRGPGYDSAEQIVERWLSGIRSLAENAKSLRGLVAGDRKGAEKPPERPEGEILRAAYEEQQEVLRDAMTALDGMVERARMILASSDDKSADSPWRKWATEISQFRTAYDAAVRRSSTHTEKMKELRSIERRLSEHRRETNTMKEEETKLSRADEAYQQARTVWQSLFLQSDNLIEEQCQELTRNSGEAIRAQFRRYAAATRFSDGLRDALAGSGVRRDKIERLGTSIVGANVPEERWKDVLTELELLADYDAEREGADERSDCPRLSAAGFTLGDLQKMGRLLTPEKWVTISLIRIESVPVFEYRAREDEYIPFINASAGQQATALLKTLLNQPGPPLIIDQPEEDLDNPVILEIVGQVWVAKQQRQLIFASHNANLVVNGDAELVVWCDHRTSGDQSRGNVAGEGAIDVPNVRDAIKSIMEGGEAAFNLRKEKYGF